MDSSAKITSKGQTVKTLDTSTLFRALEVYELDRLDFAEAYLVALAEATGDARLARA